MSLFKIRDIWSTTCDNDLFDLGCLRVANLGANKKHLYSIVTGSYNGFLRIYNPSSADNESDSFKAHDLISETSFPAPIIQIETGRFVSTSKKKHIAVLMPRKLAVYEVLAKSEGSVSHGNQFSLKFVYEHVLQRSAFNMCKGSFGAGTYRSSGSDETSRHDYLCVQSMDGMLSVFEYESFSISCFLPKVLIPGPFKYVPTTDSFVTVSSSWDLESYKYQTLATSGKSYERGDTSGEGGTAATAAKLKRLLPDFVYNLGEAALDLDVLNHSNGQCYIMVLGERSLYCLSDSCELRFMKKLDYNPSAFCVYPIVGAGGTTSGVVPPINYMISTHAKVLFVHQDVKVKWAAQVDHVPVQIAVAKINDIKGVVVTLSEDGKLKCSYLGTEPALLNPLFKDDMSKPFNFQNAEEEYRMLQGQIKHSIMNSGTVMTQSSATKSGLQISVDVPSRLDQPTGGGFNRFNQRDTELSDPIDAIPALTCKLTLRAGLEAVQGVKVTINCEHPLVAVPDVMSYANIGAIPYDQEIVFYMKTKHIPSSLEVKACAAYTYVANGAPKVTETRFRLPLKLVMKAGQQNAKMSADQNSDSQPNDQRNTDRSGTNFKKITIETNKPCINLADLFPEFAGSYVAANGNMLAAQFYGHPNINIMIQGSKSGSGRYRLQSETMESLWLISQELVQRLNAYYTKQSQSVEIYFKESLPLDEFRVIIDRHLQLRQHLERYKELLEQTCVQFRAIQKRLLIKFKDKSPTNLENMDALLEATYKQISNLSDSYISTQKELSLTTNSLNCMSSLYVLLVSIAFKLNKESVDILDAALTTQIGDTPDLGWEEIINAAIANILRNSLSKNSSKDQQPALTQLKIPIDSTRIEKQLKQFVSKLEGGASLLVDSYKVRSPEAASSVNASVGGASESNYIDYKQKQVSTPSKTIEIPQAPTRRKPRNQDSDDDEAVVRQTKPPSPPPVPAAPVAAKTRYTMGEDYEEFEPDVNTPNNTPDQSSTKAPEKPAERKPFGSSNLPTFDELIQQELKEKTTDENWNDDD